MALSKDNIISKHFSKKIFGGLNEFEVRDFLHVLAEDIRHLTLLVEKQNQRMKDMEERIQDYRDREQLLKRSIVSAQEIADKIQKDTEQKSQLILARANDKSESLILQARSSLQSVYNDIASLKRLHLQFKSSLKASLQSQMDLLEQTPLFSLSLPEGGEFPAEESFVASSTNSDTSTEDFSSSKNSEMDETTMAASKEKAFETFEKPGEKETMEPETPSLDSSEDETTDSLETLKQSLQSLEKDLF